MAYGYNPQSGYQVPAQPQPQMPNQNVQPLFPQPQGNVYNISSTLEVANVPVGAGISVALRMPENTMFIKTMQNGNPMFYPYKILPYSNEAEPQKQEPTQDFAAQLQSCTERIAALEEAIKTKKKGVEFAV